MAIGKPILEKSSQGQKRSRTQILTLSDPKIRGQDPKTLSKRAHNPLLKEAGLTKPTAAHPSGGSVYCSARNSHAILNCFGPTYVKALARHTLQDRHIREFISRNVN